MPRICYADELAKRFADFVDEYFDVPLLMTGIACDLEVGRATVYYWHRNATSPRNRRTRRALERLMERFDVDRFQRRYPDTRCRPRRGRRVKR